MQRQGRSSQQTIVQTYNRILVPSRGIYTQQYLSDSMDCSPSGSSVHGISQARILERVAISYSRDLLAVLYILKLPQVGEVNCMLSTSTHSPDQQDQKVDDAPYYLTTNQSQNVYELITPSSLNHCNKTPHYPLQVGIDSFEGISWLYPPSPGKATKLFFSTSPQTSLHISI